MNLKTIKLELPRGWRESSRMGSEDQVIIHVFHTNPLANLDPKEFQDQVIEAGSIVTTKLAVPTPGVRPINDFYKNMKGLIAGGLMPPDWTPQKLDTLWKGMTESANAERPGESDMVNDIEIIKCQDEETAWQTIKNRALQTTQGLDVPVLGNIMIPGMPKNVSIGELFQSDMLKQFIPKEQFDNFSKLQSTIKEAQRQMPKIRQDLEKRGVKYREGKLFGCRAVFIDSPNLSPSPEVKTTGSSSEGNTGGMGMGGPSPAGGDDTGPMIPPLPKFTQKYSATITSCMGILYKNFVIGGPLLLALDNLPAGNTPCYSLTKTKEIRELVKNDGMSLTSVTIAPLLSNYAREGYFNKEEVEEIYQNIMSKLK